MGTFADDNFRENQNTHFMLDAVFTVTLLRRPVERDI
jgi:hypothetical protein